jgi:hypothetical protein
MPKGTLGFYCTDQKPMAYSKWMRFYYTGKYKCMKYKNQYYTQGIDLINNLFLWLTAFGPTLPCYSVRFHLHDTTLAHINTGTQTSSLHIVKKIFGKNCCEISTFIFIFITIIHLGTGTSMSLHFTQSPHF